MLLQITSDSTVQIGLVMGVIMIAISGVLTFAATKHDSKQNASDLNELKKQVVDLEKTQRDDIKQLYIKISDMQETLTTIATTVKLLVKH